MAEIFKAGHGLEVVKEDEKKEIKEKAGLDNDDAEGTREERQLRLWINSLGIEDVFINNLFAECRDGMVLQKVIHRIDKTVVPWNKVEKNANNVFKIGINCQIAFESSQKLGI